MRRTSICLVLSASILLAACGGTESTDDAGGAASATPSDAVPTDGAEDVDAAEMSASADSDGNVFPVTVTADNGPVAIAEQPDAIISLSPTATEMLFAIGAGDQVVAVDDYSYYPPEAPVTDLSGYDPNVEAILAYEPDLVVIANDANGLLDAMDAAGVPVMVNGPAADLDDAYAQFEVLGVATGHVAGAAAAVAEVSAAVDAAIADLPEGAAGMTYFHELDPTFYTPTSATFIGSIYSLFGLVNIADAAAEDGNTFPQLSEEYIIEANPDLVFFSDGYAVSAEDVLARPGWGEVTAIANGAVVELDPDTSSRWGPRIVEFIRAVADAVDAYALTY